MADNVGFTPGSGSIIAADDVGGALHQRIKPTFGEDGVAVDVSQTNPLPVAVEGISILKRIALLLKPLGFVGQSGRLAVEPVQATATNLNATVVQPTPANLNATVVQGNAASLQMTAVQASPTSLNVSAYQATATSLNATVVQPTAANLNMTANVATVGSVPGFDLMKAMSRAAYNTGIRANIS